jgi:hypothetical protein
MRHARVCLHRQHCTTTHAPFPAVFLTQLVTAPQRQATLQQRRVLVSELRQSHDACHCPTYLRPCLLFKSESLSDAVYLKSDSTLSSSSPDSVYASVSDSMPLCHYLNDWAVLTPRNAPGHQGNRRWKAFALLTEPVMRMMLPNMMLILFIDLFQSQHCDTAWSTNVYRMCSL